MSTPRPGVDTLGQAQPGPVRATGPSACGAAPFDPMSCLNLFLVEDSPVIRRSLVAALEELAPVRVVGHADGAAQALDWLDAHGRECDLVVVDLFLREGSGLDLLRRLHRQPHPPTRVVLSNYANADLRRQCLALGAERVFDKSGDIDELIDYCQSLATRASPRA
jgi:DNA-binding NarL/FixJ family response regulator